MGISRNTVKKYCEGEKVPWERKTPEREASVLTEDVLAFITSCLEEDEAEGLKNNDIQQDEFMTASLKKKVSRAANLRSDVPSIRSVVRYHRHSSHFSSILLMRSRSIGVKPQFISMAKKL